MPPRLSLPVADQAPEIPLYTADREQFLKDIWEVTQSNIASTITAGLAYPSKMDCPAWGIPADECRTGSKLAKVKGTVCEGCYAQKGTFMMSSVRKKLRAAFEGLLNPLWTPAMTVEIHRYAEDRFRWFHSGDLQGINHLRNIIRVCLETPEIMHWLPTREYETVLACEDMIPPNLRIRFSATKIDGARPKGWPYTSTVVTDKNKATCPTSLKGGNCGDHDCVACWDETPNTAYAKH